MPQFFMICGTTLNSVIYNPCQDFSRHLIAAVLPFRIYHIKHAETGFCAMSRDWLINQKATWQLSSNLPVGTHTGAVIDIYFLTLPSSCQALQSLESGSIAKQHIGFWHHSWRLTLQVAGIHIQSHVDIINVHNTMHSFVNTISIQHTALRCSNVGRI